ncbi:AlpA family transcriptional regulator [Endozoicomonas sp. SESOKO4]|uniref:helix-turn-helix transcriptional regulator n=1 Tax=Endozoicomonas sp. SESOKO4 TaxID=2828745 RepID=UPI002147C4ED|nr:AlpA family phage regulatory protein [Endozoicomonas sp. SESOKO4]
MADQSKANLSDTHPDRWIKLPEVCELTTYSRSSIYRLIAGGAFPAGIRLSARCTVWREKTILAYMAMRENEAANQTEFVQGA